MGYSPRSHRELNITEQLRYVYTYLMNRKVCKTHTYIYGIRHNKTNTYASNSQVEKQKNKNFTAYSFPPPTLPTVLVFMLDIHCFFFLIVLFCMMSKQHFG